MKKAFPYFAFIGLMLAFAACSKKNDVAPDAGSAVAGTYTMNYIRFDSAGVFQDSLTLPFTYAGQTLSGSIIATRISATVDSLTITLQQTGAQSQSLPLGRVDVQASGSSYDLYYSSTKIGTTNGTTITIDTDPNRQGDVRYIFRGRK